MTPEQREAALRLADYWEADSWPGGLSGKKMDETAALLRELAAEPQGEPVAWVHEWAPNAPMIGKSLHWTQHTPHEEKEIVRTPLYTHPPQQRQPLTDEMIADIVASFDGNDDWNLHDFARAVERAHGIGGGHD